MNNYQNEFNWNFGGTEERDDQDRLPDFLLKRLPGYIKDFSNPTVDEYGTIHLNLILNDDFYTAFTRHHKMVEGPNIYVVKDQIEKDLRNMFLNN